MSGGDAYNGTSITASGDIFGKNLVNDSASFSTRFENVTASLGNITASISTLTDNQTSATNSIADITASITTINQNQTSATNSIADITASIVTINENQSKFGHLLVRVWKIFDGEMEASWHPQQLHRNGGT